MLIRSCCFAIQDTYTTRQKLDDVICNVIVFNDVIVFKNLITLLFAITSLFSLAYNFSYLKNKLIYIGMDSKIRQSFLSKQSNEFFCLLAEVMNSRKMLHIQNVFFKKKFFRAQMYLFYVKFVDLNIYEFIHMSFSIDYPFSFTQQNQFYYLIEKS